MYYYIFDIKKCKKRSQVESIKNQLSVMGISGEFTYPTGAQSIQQLVENGLAKQYTTIVAIGSDEIANQVASAMVGKKEAMGFIPLEVSPSLSALIGTDNWKDACEVLRYRKINEMRLGKTASGNHFLTTVELALTHPIDITMELKDSIVQARVKDFSIVNYHPQIKKIGDDYLDIIFNSVSPSESMLSKFSTIFGAAKQNDAKTLSLIRARSLRLFTKTQIPLVCGDATIAKTPQFIESSDEYLRLITARKISTVE